jgi:hypothetical protein
MSFRLSLVVAAAAATLTLTIGVPAAAAAPPSTTTDPARAAAGWLAQQLVDGNHVVFAFDGKTFDAGGTADVIFALAASHSGKDAIDAAVAYLARNIDGYIAAGTAGNYDGSVGKAALAAIAADKDPRAFGGHDLLQMLKADECKTAEGSADDFDHTYCPAAGSGQNIYSSISQSFIVIAEARGGSISQSAIDYLRSLQCDGDGGFTVGTTGGKGCTSDIDATAYAVMALQAAGGEHDAVTRAADYLQRKRASNGAWVTNGGANADSTGLATAALEAAGRDASTSRRWLIGQQLTTGPTAGKGASRGALKYQGKFDPSGSIKATADGMLGLVPGASLATLDARGASAGTAMLALDDPTLGHARVKPGGTQHVTGTGFMGGEQVRATVHSTPVRVGVAKASAAGTTSLTFTVPATLAAGTHSVVLTGATSGLSSSATFTVVAVAAAPSTTAPAATATPTAPVLAATGRDGRQTGWEVLAGLGCVGLGGLALFAGRRRAAHR